MAPLKHREPRFRTTVPRCRLTNDSAAAARRGHAPCRGATGAGIRLNHECTRTITKRMQASVTRCLRGEREVQHQPVVKGRTKNARPIIGGHRKAPEGTKRRGDLRGLLCLVVAKGCLTGEERTREDCPVADRAYRGARNHDMLSDPFATAEARRLRWERGPPARSGEPADEPCALRSGDLFMPQSTQRTTRSSHHRGTEVGSEMAESSSTTGANVLCVLRGSRCFLWRAGDFSAD